MKKYIKADDWCILEEGFNPDNHQASESIFSLGNGKMGQRANFEEKYSGPCLQGSYIAGVYFPDKTRVGWWKNGYPEYFAKVLNSPNWIGIDVKVDGTELDLYKCEVENFVRKLNMKEGFLEREFEATLQNNRKIYVKTKRFLSITDTEIGVIKYEITPINFSGKIVFTPYIDGDIKNEDSNYDEKFWKVLCVESSDGITYLESVTNKSNFTCGFATKFRMRLSGKEINTTSEVIQDSKWIGHHIVMEVKEKETVCLEKYAAVTSSLNYDTSELKAKSCKLVESAFNKGFDVLFDAHKNKWAEKWVHSDIKIEGDVEAQQGIRFNIFHLNQTYTGEDERLNVGPKGFTGEKYGGTTYWDTEAYCIPFFLMTSPSEVTRQLLIYRYKHLQKAIANAHKLGFGNGAALYPMVTANGEECHNEWEITFEEIHRNGAIAFAIHNYIRHTGDKKYLDEYGLEVLVGISRFWSQRITFSESRKKYVMLGVTGPNEYENNVNNNWYTNKMATWCLKYTLEAMDYVAKNYSNRYEEIVKKLHWDDKEAIRWRDIIDKMHFPYNEELQVFMQQDGFMDKEQIFAADLDPAERPINQHWSWDRILRSNFIKQADTLQGIYVFEDEFSIEEIERNFLFYEPRTVHESSLSPCVYSILATKIGQMDKAYEMYLRTSRLDLDDYNAEVHEGLHITSMAGTWMAIVEGFGGKRAYDEKLYLSPQIPKEWESYSFRIRFKGSDLNVLVAKEKVGVENLSNKEVSLVVFDKELKIEANDNISITI